MRILLIGGTGNISSAVTRQLAESDHEVWLLNRGKRQQKVPQGVNTLVGDINNEAEVAKLLKDRVYDVVCQFIAFQPEQIERDIRLFQGRIQQYVFISSASVYHKPVPHYLITESSSLANPFSPYAQGKIACEEVLMKAYRQQQFPVTIVRPSHTYSEQMVPVGVRGPKGSWQVVKRMLEGKPVIIQGDGTSLWTMTWSEDFARGFIGLLGHPKAIGEAFHITSDETITWNQVYQSIANALGVDLNAYHIASDFLCAVAPKEWGFLANLKGDKSESVVFDCSKLKRLVPDYQATTPFHQGVRRSVDYILKHFELQVEDPEFDAWCDHVIATMEQAKNEGVSK